MNDPIQAKYQEALAQLGRSIKTFCDTMYGPDKVGFTILMFEFGNVKSGRMNYISSANREDMKTALKEMLAQMEGMPSQTGRG